MPAGPPLRSRRAGTPSSEVRESRGHAIASVIFRFFADTDFAGRELQNRRRIPGQGRTIPLRSRRVDQQVAVRCRDKVRTTAQTTGPGIGTSRILYCVIASRLRTASHDGMSTSSSWLACSCQVGNAVSLDAIIADVLIPIGDSWPTEDKRLYRQTAALVPRSS